MGQQDASRLTSKEEKARGCGSKLFLLFLVQVFLHSCVCRSSRAQTNTNTTKKEKRKKKKATCFSVRNGRNEGEKMEKMNLRQMEHKPFDE